MHKRNTPPTYMGAHLKRNVLFICTANLQRSPTAESLFQNWGGSLETKSAGINPVSGGTLLTQELVDWADLILAMEAVHAYYVTAHFKCDSSKIRVLGIRDQYYRDDPELIQELKEKIAPIIDHLCG
ncbi:MAG: phosphotyrosine protein phosphatase [Candidatus Bathyarchaeia archaeon]